MFRHSVRDTVLLSGWLFADLFLGLMMIFMVSMQPPPPPRMKVSPASLKPGDSQCTGGPSVFQCTVTLTGDAQSLGIVHWIASTDIGNAVNNTGQVSFAPAKGDLAPGKSTQVTIANIPCQNGSFTFSGQREVFPVTVAWLCTPKQPRLETHYETFTLAVPDIQALLNNDAGAVDNIKQQVMNQPILQGRSVGLVIVYGGTLGGGVTQAQAIAGEVYKILDSMRNSFPPLNRAAPYDKLFLLGGSASTVTVQVYLFEK
jgi:hypothetical protein